MVIKSINITDNGITHSQPARYEQHFVDGTIIYSDTLPDRNAFKAESKITSKFLLDDIVDVVADHALPEDLTNNPWKIYSIIIESDHTFYKIESIKDNDCLTLTEGALKLHAT